MNFTTLNKGVELLFAERRRLLWKRILQVTFLLILTHAVLSGCLGYWSAKYPWSGWTLKALALFPYVYLTLPIYGFWVWQTLTQAIPSIAKGWDRANANAPDIFQSLLSLDNHSDETLKALEKLYTEFWPQLIIQRMAFPWRWGLIVLGFSFGLIFSAAYLSGNNSKFYASIIHPQRTLAAIPLLHFEISQNHFVIGDEDTLNVTALLKNYFPGQNVFAHVQIGNEEKRFLLMPHKIVPANDSTASFSLNFAYGPVKRDFFFFFTGENGKSKRFLAQVKSAPTFSQLQFIVQPPAYTNLGPDTLPRGQVHFEVLPGSQVVINAQANRDLQKAELSIHYADSVKANQFRDLGKGQNYTWRGGVREAQTLTFKLCDRDGLLNHTQLQAQIEMLRDEAPQLTLINPRPQDVLNRSLLLPLQVKVHDDFGISRLQLHYRISNENNQNRTGIVSARFWWKKESEMAEFTWNLDSLGLRPENSLEIYFQAWDNDAISGNKSGKSERIILRMPSLEEWLADLQKQEGNALTSLKSATERQKQVNHKLDQVQSAPKEDAPPSITEYDIQRIMLRDPLEHGKRVQALMQKAYPKLAEHMLKAEKDLPLNNPANLPVEERLTLLKKIQKNQQEELTQLAQIEKTMEQPEKGDKGNKVAPADKNKLAAEKTHLQDLKNEAKKNAENQKDLQGLFEDEKKQSAFKQQLQEQGAKDQLEVAKDLQQASEDLQKFMQKSMDNKLLSPELLDKMKKVRELTKELLSDSLKDLLREKMAGQEVNPEDLQKEMNKLMENREQLQQDIDRTLSMLQNLREMQKIESWKNRLEDLEEREKNVATTLARENQKKISEDSHKLLAELNKEADKQKMYADINEAFQKEKVTEDMQAAEELMSDNQKKTEAKQAAGKVQKKLAKMQKILAEATAEGGEGLEIDLSEIDNITQESLELMHLQNLIRSGKSQRQSEGWEGDEPSLYGSVEQVARYLQDHLKVLSGELPFVSPVLLSEVRQLQITAAAAAKEYNGDKADLALQHSENVSRELLKLLKFARNQQASGNSGSSGKSKGQGKEGKEGSDGKSGKNGKGKKSSGQGHGDFASQLKGMSGKQMAINQATTELLHAMMEARSQGKSANSLSPGQSPQGMANQQGELGEQIEGLAEKDNAGGGSAQKLHQLAEQARNLEKELRQGRLNPEELQQKQQRFQTRLLEAANAMEERGESPEREAKSYQGNASENQIANAMSPDKVRDLLQAARKNAKNWKLDSNQRKIVEKYFETLMAQ